MAKGIGFALHVTIQIDDSSQKIYGIITPMTEIEIIGHMSTMALKVALDGNGYDQQVVIQFIKVNWQKMTLSNKYQIVEMVREKLANRRFYTDNKVFSAQLHEWEMFADWVENSI